MQGRPGVIDCMVGIANCCVINAVQSAILQSYNMLVLFWVCDERGGCAYIKHTVTIL